MSSSLQKRAYQAVLGIAIESRRLDMMEQVIHMCESLTLTLTLAGWTCARA